MPQPLVLADAAAIALFAASALSAVVADAGQSGSRLRFLTLSLRLLRLLHRLLCLGLNAQPPLGPQLGRCRSRRGGMRRALVCASCCDVQTKRAAALVEWLDGALLWTAAETRWSLERVCSCCGGSSVRAATGHAKARGAVGVQANGSVGAFSDQEAASALALK
jgi:hypothetical protein